MNHPLAVITLQSQQACTEALGRDPCPRRQPGGSGFLTLAPSSVTNNGVGVGVETGWRGLPLSGPTASLNNDVGVSTLRKSWKSPLTRVVCTSETPSPNG